MITDKVYSHILFNILSTYTYARELFISGSILKGRRVRKKNSIYQVYRFSVESLEAIKDLVSGTQLFSNEQLIL